MYCLLESGRAGRDGLVSHCLLFYNNQDRHKWLRLMNQELQNNRGSANSYEVHKVHVDNLYRMAQLVFTYFTELLLILFDI